VVGAGLEDNAADEELAAIGGNLIANYRVDVVDQLKKEAEKYQAVESV